MKESNDMCSKLTSLLLTTTLITISAPGAAQDAGNSPPYAPNWESLEKHTPAPEWFRDAKFGIYAHWGVYSAAEGSRNTDWYSRHMYVEGHQNRIEHEKNHGPPSKFGYKDLIPLFTAEKFDADEWAELYVEAGAKFAGPVGEHADGFAMWDSKISKGCLRGSRRSARTTSSPSSPSPTRSRPPHTWCSPTTGCAPIRSTS